MARPPQVKALKGQRKEEGDRQQKSDSERERELEREIQPASLQERKSATETTKDTKVTGGRE